MKKYNKQLIEDYINGNDIDNYSIEELENDKEFMMLVINNCNDSNIYNLCGDKVKKDYEFVKFLINKFKNNINFIYNVADYYLENEEDETRNLEIAIIMSELSKNNIKEQNKYKIIAESIYDLKRVQLEILKMDRDNELDQTNIGMGFYIIFDLYNDNKLILDFYAKNFIKSIFKENKIDLEELLHKQFRNPESITKEGLNTYIINFISNYDDMLSSYLSTNIILIEDLKNQIKGIQKKWNSFNLYKEQNKYNDMFDKVHKYMENVDITCVLSENNLLYYIGKELNIADKIARYEGLDEDDYLMIINDIDDDFFKETFEVSQSDYFNYLTLKRIIVSTIFGKNDNNISEKNTNKLIKINFKKYN